ncbi:hypothetical protein AVEN_36303-1 [Araneus ventricosus]|uniref:Uncharacterized protein n=1 Tax=Araneus ventricosus TaxID=182803 RepID=A0A4Y2PWQ2_ARAVE|nr:hypothetical protein AVEN_36303-1 [Araneus ventricosus]
MKKKKIQWNMVSHMPLNSENRENASLTVKGKKQRSENIYWTKIGEKQLVVPNTNFLVTIIVQINVCMIHCIGPNDARRNGWQTRWKIPGASRISAAAVTVLDISSSGVS